MWQKIKDNRDWILIIFGAVLIIIAALNLINFSSYFIIDDTNISLAVDQDLSGCSDKTGRIQGNEFRREACDPVPYPGRIRSRLA